MKSFLARFFTHFSPLLRKAALSAVIAFSLIGLVACSSSKSVKKVQPSSTAVVALVSSGPDEVKKKFGEPTRVSKTPENHLLWIYEPSWKIIPNDKGTLYVEFQDGKVVKIFRIE